MCVCVCVCVCKSDVRIQFVTMFLIWPFDSKDSLNSLYQKCVYLSSTSKASFYFSQLYFLFRDQNICIFHSLKTKDLIWIHCFLTHATSKNLNQAVWLVKLITIFLLLKEKSESVSCSVVSDSLRFYGLQPIRLPCPWNSPGKSTGVGCHFLLQRIFLTQGLNQGCLHCKWILYHLSHQGRPFFWKIYKLDNLRQMRTVGNFRNNGEPRIL